MLATRRFQGQPPRSRLQRTPRLTARWAWLLVLFAGFCWLFLGSSVGRVRAIEIEGSQAIGKQDAEERVRLALTGRRWMFVRRDAFVAYDRTAVRAALTHPRIASANVRRTISGGIRITIIEKQTAAFWIVGERVFAVDDQGVIIEELYNPSESMLRFTNLVSLDAPAPGTTVLRNQQIQKAREIESGLAAQTISVQRFTVTNDPYALTAVTDGTSILFSTRLELSLQLRKLQTFIEARRVPGVVVPLPRHIDLRFGERRVYFK